MYAKNNLSTCSKSKSDNELQARYTSAAAHLKDDDEHRERKQNKYNEGREEVDQNKEIIKGLEDKLSLLMLYTTELETKYETQMKILADKVTKLENNATEAKSNDIMELSRKTNLLSKELPKIDLSLRLLENTSYSGSMIWKVDNVARRIQQAEIGSVSALHSAPVFTCQYGYKFCCRLYLNGDGLGKTTHVSLFFVMMKSEYDEILKWPFEKVITFRLINQKNPQDDLIETFHSDPESSSFRKPRKEMNVASGCPTFIEKEKLISGGFIKNDTLFIEVSVS